MVPIPRYRNWAPSFPMKLQKLPPKNGIDRVQSKICRPNVLYSSTLNTPVTTRHVPKNLLPSDGSTKSRPVTPAAMRMSSAINARLGLMKPVIGRKIGQPRCKRAPCVLPRPPRITARLSQLLFHIIQPLLQLSHFLLLSVNFCINGVDVGTRILLLHGLLRVRVILHLGLFQLASQNLEFLLGLCNLVALDLKPPPPRRLAIWILGLGRFSGFGGVPGFRTVSRLRAVTGLGGASRRLHCRRGRRAAGVPRGRSRRRHWFRRALLHIIVCVNLLRLRGVFFRFAGFPRGIRHGIARLLRGCRESNQAQSRNNDATLHPESHSHLVLPPGAARRLRQSLRCLPALILLLLARCAAWVA